MAMVVETPSMATTTPVTSTKNKAYRKILEGIRVSKDSSLIQAWSQAYELLSSKPSANAATGQHNQQLSKMEEAYQILREAGDPTTKFVKNNQNIEGKDDNDGRPSMVVVPIPVLEAIRYVLVNRGNSDDESIDLDEMLSKEMSLSLAFTPPKSTFLSSFSTSDDSGSSKNKEKFRKRMERLRLQHEETKYNKLTTNLQDRRQDDDITAKSMTYAASVGLNMVVAPLSFGCFMYFFAGGIMDYVLAWFQSDDDDNDDKLSTRTNSGGTDIKRVIIGVISGVAMMFIEMILFVIRTHEFEEHSRKKKIMKQKQGVGGVRPFGAYSKGMKSDYYSTEPRPSSSSKVPTNKMKQQQRRQSLTQEEKETKKKN